MTSEKVLVTGATGFIGQALIRQLLLRQEAEVIALVRRRSQELPNAVQQFVCSGGDPSFPDDVATVIHLAGRAHVLKDSSGSSLDMYRVDNVEYTVNLARKALASGVKRFVFISSIGVNGSATGRVPFNEESVPSPKADYAISKWEAEQAMTGLLKGSGMELVIIRPPLVYAGHAPGNFRRLLRLVATGLPMPFASIHNCRSMIALENLVDFIFLCSRHPAAANETFLVADGMDFSTAQIIERLAEGMDKGILLFPAPEGLMRWGARAVGMRGAFEQLCASLVIDSSKARDVLGWRAPVDAGMALVDAGRKFRAARRRSR